MQNCGRKDLKEENILGPNGILDNNIKMSHKETGWEFVDIIHIKHQWRDLVNMEMDLQVR
jgi:hypothetical protein